MADKQTLYLVDGSNLIFRAFFAIRGLSNSQGMPTNAIYGFTAMLLKLVKDYQPDYAAVVLDVSDKSFRTELYPDYKAHRPPMPDDLRVQWPRVSEVIRAFNIPALELEGYEADDIIATLAERARARGVDVVIVSSDKDLMQLVGDGTKMLDTMKDTLYGPAEVVAKMGVPPHQIVDLLGLMGDTSDNIPGVPGVGAKTAAKLLTEFESIDGIYENIDKIKGKRREKLEENKDQAYLSQKLATVDREVPIEVPFEQLAMEAPDRAKLTELFAEFEFRTWHREFHDPDAIDGKGGLSRDGDKLVADEGSLQDLVTALEGAELIAFDTETTGLDTLTADLVGLSFAVDTDGAWYVPVGHTGEGREGQLPRDVVLSALKPVLEDPTRPKAAQNAKYDLQILEQHGVSVRGLAFDPMLASYLFDPGPGRHGLDTLALRRLNHKTIKFEDVAGTKDPEDGFAGVPVDQAVAYACEDAQVVRALVDSLQPDLDGAGLLPVFEQIELPLVPILARMERTGIGVDGDRLRELSEEFAGRAADLKARCHELAGEKFNLGSPKQLGVILFEKLGLPPSKRTKTGFSTDSSVLEGLARQHELPRLLLEWRSVTKLKSTYTDVLPTLVHPKTGRIHTSFNQAVAATGRLSSADPNLQNIPVRTEDGRKIRDAFVADEGSVLLSCDYSQIELRVLAHLCGDENLLQGFRDGADVHARTAAMLFGVFEDMVSREQRSMAKAVNFGILYGMSAFRLAREQSISRKEASGIIERYYARYPKIQAWKEETLERARDEGHVTTLSGRIRRLPDLKSSSHQARTAAERVAINTPVQGSAADIIKEAMIAVDGRLRAEAPDTRMLLQVHDELVFEVPEGDLERVTSIVREAMEGAEALAATLVVDAGHGRTWLEAH